MLISILLFFNNTSSYRISLSQLSRIYNIKKVILITINICRSCVAFSAKNRILGVAAKNQQVTNMKNTVTNFKRFLGRKYNDPQVQRELRHAPFRVEERPDGGVGVRVEYLGEEKVFSPEQLTAMLFTKLKEISTAALQTQVNDCVISVPSYFTNTERRALLDAASIAGMIVVGFV